MAERWLILHKWKAVSFAVDMHYFYNHDREHESFIKEIQASTDEKTVQQHRTIQSGGDCRLAANNHW